MHIQLSDHFTCRKLLRFTLPSIAMMIFTSVYSVVDGYFVSNYAGKTAFAAVNLIMPALMILESAAVMLFPRIWGIGGIWFSVVFAEGAALLLGVTLLIAKRKKYGY